MASEVSPSVDAPRPGIVAEAQSIWRATPNRAALLILLTAWVVLFHWLGNSTLGYVNTPSLFGWWTWTLKNTPDEEHAWLIPFVVLALLWSRRDEFLSLTKRAWLPALGVLLLAMLLHTTGYVIQQTRLCVVAFFLGVFGISGAMLGRQWMNTAMVPFSLFVFCVPFGKDGTEIVSFPLRLMATKITAVFCDLVLGIKVMQNGTQLLDAGGSYQYEVAAACSGIRSLTAIVAFSVIYAYLSFKTGWRRLLIVAAAIPLAVIANVFRLTLIVLAAEAFGQGAGNYVHESSAFSLVPYVPAIGGMLLLGWWISEDRKARRNAEVPVIGGVTQKS